MAFNPTRRLALTLEAVLRVTLVHELGRWFFTLVSRYQFQITYCNRFTKYSGGGPYSVSPDFLDAFSSQNFKRFSPLIS